MLKSMTIPTVFLQGSLYLHASLEQNYKFWNKTYPICMHSRGYKAFSQGLSHFTFPTTL